MTPAALWTILRPFAPWLAAPALALGVWVWRDAAGDARAREAAGRARELCDMTWRAREAAAEARMRETENAILRQMDAIRPDPAGVPGRLRDGSFFAAPGAAGDSLPPN